MAFADGGNFLTCVQGSALCWRLSWVVGSKNDDFLNYLSFFIVGTNFLSIVYVPSGSRSPQLVHFRLSRLLSCVLPETICQSLFTLLDSAFYPSVPPVMVLNPEYLFFFLLDHKFHMNSLFSLLFCLWNVYLPLLLWLGVVTRVSVWLKTRPCLFPTCSRSHEVFSFHLSSSFPQTQASLFRTTIFFTKAFSWEEPRTFALTVLARSHIIPSNTSYHTWLRCPSSVSTPSGQFLSMSLFHCSIARDAGPEFDNVKNSNFLTFHIVFFLSVPISWFSSGFFERLQLN